MWHFYADITIIRPNKSLTLKCSFQEWARTWRQLVPPNISWNYLSSGTVLLELCSWNYVSNSTPSIISIKMVSSAFWGEIQAWLHLNLNKPSHSSFLVLEDLSHPKSVILPNFPCVQWRWVLPFRALLWQFSSISTFIHSFTIFWDGIPK